MPLISIPDLIIKRMINHKIKQLDRSKLFEFCKLRLIKIREDFLKPSSRCWYETRILEKVLEIEFRFVPTRNEKFLSFNAFTQTNRSRMKCCLYFKTSSAGNT